MKKLLTRLMLVISMLTILAGCGTAKESTGSETKSTSAAASDNNKTVENKHTIKDARTTLEFDKIPERIVVLQWQEAEFLLALGIQPVGFADIPNWDLWVNIEPKLAADVVDVGSRVEPSLEAIAELKPDLIIGTLSWHEGYLEQLESIAPTALFETSINGTNYTNEYDKMLDTFREFGTFFDKEAEAEAVIAKLEKTISDGQEKLKDAEFPTKEFLAAMAYSGTQAPEFRLYNNRSQTATLISKLGLTNALTEPKGDGTFDVTNVEALTAFKDVLFMHIVQDTDNVFENNLKGASVWEDLYFVQKDQMYGLGGDTWPQGGPYSAITIVNKTVESLTSAEGK
ncbi:iron complex transport system substrate-binding protein [Paenibacillus uliginis N3/975]|uniref:Iron complex transport system substrate-binding protein n=1 Tax=Paenibacillus uliginis N3/975 TaxID=1313296 RepID=A0A1X7HFV5_9BACL|nr:iron-siderophore ABC transporter substrate-binding protein [Paenibacillus uliginis]SMF85976.1 iron complex transport system substrate-binding protein [Paenibacillus uliginis N3/975]